MKSYGEHKKIEQESRIVEKLIPTNSQLGRNLLNRRGDKFMKHAKRLVQISRSGLTDNNLCCRQTARRGDFTPNDSTPYSRHPQVKQILVAVFFSILMVSIPKITNAAQFGINETAAGRTVNLPFAPVTGALFLCEGATLGNRCQGGTNFESDVVFFNAANMTASMTSDPAEVADPADGLVFTFDCAVVTCRSIRELATGATLYIPAVGDPGFDSGGSGASYLITSDAPEIPEPTAFLLLALGLSGLRVIRWHLVWMFSTVGGNGPEKRIKPACNSRFARITSLG
jgi:hypothetical protein